MAIVQVKDAEGSVLDWMVAKCAGYLHKQDYGWTVVLPIPGEPVHLPFPKCFSPSTRWAQGGTIIEREIGNLWKHNKLDPNDPDVWTAAAYCKAQDGTLLYYEDGPTPLIAAMRCYVSSVLGNEVEVPDELI